SPSRWTQCLCFCHSRVSHSRFSEIDPERAFMVLSDFLPDTQPRLADLTSCEDWLARAALAGMPHACSALLTLLEEIEAHPPRHSPYVQILERLRYPVMHAEAEQAKGFAGKPLPLNHSEAAAFVQANGLWAAMLRAYEIGRASCRERV